MNGKLDLSGLHKLRKDLKQVAKKEIEWGFPDASDMHTKAGTSLGRLAIWQEEGTFAAGGGQRIPPRPAFQESLLKLQTGGFERSLERDIQRLLYNKITPRHFLDRTGDVLVNSYRKSMISWHSTGSMHPNNAASTIKKKGFDQPYLETGELVRGVKYDIKSRSSIG